MARPLRIEYPGALYHVTARGNERKNIFLCDADRRAFIDVLKKTLEVHQIICHAYCLMDNHVHLLLETPNANLSLMMRDCLGNYAQYFNQNHERVGHLFQSRYKAFLVEKETYFLAVARYIVLNPVRAKMVMKPGEWRWSNFRATAGIIHGPLWLTSDDTLKYFNRYAKKSRNQQELQKKYCEFVYAGYDEPSPFHEIEEGMILGSQQFIYQVWENEEGKETNLEIPRSERMLGRPTLEDIFYDVYTKKERDIAIISARNRCRYLITEIAQYLCLSPSTVGKIAREKYHV